MNDKWAGKPTILFFVNVFGGFIFLCVIPDSQLISFTPPQAVAVAVDDAGADADDAAVTGFGSQP
jgi:hypothetical protein